MNKSIRAVLLGVLSSLFFAFTFIFNRSMNVGGGYWMWGASLRYIITLPILAIIVAFSGSFTAVFSEIKKHPINWILWSTVGFGCFYFFMSMGSVFGESWFVSATWQLTIIAGALLTPVFGKPMPKKNIMWGLVILVGIFMMQASHIGSSSFTTKQFLLTLIPIAIAAFAYPLGNRKIMGIASQELKTMERLFGMVLCSIPFWIVVAVVAFCNAGVPSGSQVLNAGTIALFSGTIATGLFFHATDMVKDNMKHLAVVEATQCGEVVFTLLGGLLVLGDAAPTVVASIGIAVIVFGMIMNSLSVRK